MEVEAPSASGGGGLFGLFGGGGKVEAELPVVEVKGGKVKAPEVDLKVDVKAPKVDVKLPKGDVKVDIKVSRPPAACCKPAGCLKQFLLCRLGGCIDKQPGCKMQCLYS